jgi:hypothetical protein
MLRARTLWYRRLEDVVRRMPVMARLSVFRFASLIGCVAVTVAMTGVQRRPEFV